MNYVVRAVFRRALAGTVIVWPKFNKSISKMSVSKKAVFALTLGLGVALGVAVVFYHVADRFQPGLEEQVTPIASKREHNNQAAPSTDSPQKIQTLTASQSVPSESSPQGESAETRTEANSLETLSDREMESFTDSEQQQQGAEDSAASETVNLLDAIPRTTSDVNALLSQYQSANDQALKSRLRTLLASSNDAAVEPYALSQIVSESDPAAQKDWLALLAQRGIAASDTRQTILKLIPSLTNAQTQRYAITALEPAVVPIDQRQAVVRELANFSQAGNEEVRSAAIEMIGRWGDPSYAHVIENALFDPAASVRSAALFAAYTSTVRTEQIKSSLLKIMQSDDESWDFRMDAYSALSSYQLNAQEHQQLYRFDREKQTFLGQPHNKKG